MKLITRILFCGVLILVFNLTFCQEVFAVTVSINNTPALIENSDQFQVAASMSGATNATNYLRVDLYKDGTTNYFGETYNGSDWYEGGDGKNYFPVQVQNSSASANLQVRLGNPSSTDYPGPGTYKLRIRRYTASGNAASNDEQTPVDVQITYVFAAPSQAPTPTPHIATTPNTAPVKTQTPTPLKIPTEKPVPRLTTEATPQILGEAVSNSTPVPSEAPHGILENKNQSRSPIVAVILIVLGLIFVGVSCYVAFRKTNKESKAETLI